MTLIPLEKDIFPKNTISIVITNLLLDAEKFLKQQTSFNPAMRYYYFFLICSEYLNYSISLTILHQL